MALASNLCILCCLMEVDALGHYDCLYKAVPCMKELMMTVDPYGTQYQVSEVHPWAASGIFMQILWLCLKVGHLADLPIALYRT